MSEQTGIKDDDGRDIMSTDTLTGCYGIPPVAVTSTVERDNGVRMCVQVGHNPERAPLCDGVRWLGLTVGGEL